MMSTRSGKRIHSSISENIENLSEIRIERNTRSKRGKENSGEVATDKTINFVSRPSADEIGSTQHGTENSSKSVRKSRRHTLKTLNTPAVDYDALNDRKSIRQSRRTQKEGIIQQTNVFIEENIEVGKEIRKNKKKRAVIENLENEPVITKKKTNKKKRKSNSFIVEELVTGEHNKSFNKSNVSIDSFHSAAGSPGNIKDDNLKIKDNIGNSRDKKNSSAVTSYHSVKNVKGSKKKNKKTEKNNYFETSINKSVKLSASNESLEPSVNKKEVIEVTDVNNFEKEISGSFKTNSKQKRSKEINVLSDTENTHTKTELIHSMEIHNIIDTNFHSAQLKKKTKEKNKIINTSSNMDFINTPQVKETVYGLESLSPLNNSYKKKRKSNSKNSSSDKIETSITLLNKCNKEISDNKIIEIKIQSDENTVNHTNGSEKPRKSISQDATYEKINLYDTNLDETFDKNKSLIKDSNLAKELSHNSSRKESSIKNTTYDKIDDNVVDIDTTFNKDTSNNSNAEANSTAKKCRSSRVSIPQGVDSTILNSTYDKISKDDNSSICNNTYDKPKSDTTFERSKDNLDGDNTLNLIIKPSIISSDNTDMSSDMSEYCSRISITSDDSRTENIVNTTPLLIESSMDESKMILSSLIINKTTTPLKKEDKSKTITPDKQGRASDYNKSPLKQEESFSETKTTPLKRDGTYTELQKTPTKHLTTLTERDDTTTTLKREGTFTKESPDATSPKPKPVDSTPTRRKSLPSPGRTPFSSSRSGSRGRVTLNVTHSIEKPQGRSSVAAAPPRLTRVMFCSPVDNPVAVAQMKGKIIKSNLKGSSKSFMFDESVSASERCGPRRRSRTQSVAPAAARARTTSAAARLQAPVEAQVASPISKSGTRSRTKLPDFAALHRKQFSKMESLDECQRRRARRARALLTPTAPATSTASLTPIAPLAPIASLTPIAPLTPIVSKRALHGNNPKETSHAAQAEKRPVIQKSKDNKNQSYTRFGFKLNLDVNPFSVPAKTADIDQKEVIKPKRQATLPSLAGTTQRKEAARQAVMKEKSFTDKRHADRHQNRTVIKGVRTNRRFELQMKMRNID